MVTNIPSTKVTGSLQEGLPRESLRRWGHSMAQQGTMLYIFGGYGGCSAHKRLNDLMAINVSAGTAYSPAITGE